MRQPLTAADTVNFIDGATCHYCGVRLHRSVIGAHENLEHTYEKKIDEAKDPVEIARIVRERMMEEAITSTQSAEVVGLSKLRESILAGAVSAISAKKAFADISIT